MSFSEETDDDGRGSPVIPLVGFINSFSAANDRNNNTDSDIGHIVQSVIDSQLTAADKKMRTINTKSKEILSSELSSEDSENSMDDVIKQESERKGKHKRKHSQHDIADERPAKKQKKNVTRESESDELFSSEESDDSVAESYEPKRKSSMKSTRLLSKSLSLSKRKSFTQTPTVSKVLPNTSTPKDKPGASSAISMELPMTFECPDKYKQLELVTDAGAAMEDLEDDDVELWLCKVPFDMDMTLLNGKKVDLTGPVVIKEEEKNSCVMKTEIHFQKYENNEDANALTVLAPSKEDKFLHPVCKDITGLMTVRECPEPAPYILPAHRPKVKRQLPPGLKQRYFPFGSDSPKVLDVNATKHKKKKSKKDKRNSYES